MLTALLTSALAQPLEEWDALDAAAWGDRPAPTPQEQERMLAQAEALLALGDARGALAQLQEARCRQDPACLPRAAEIAGAVLLDELEGLADPRALFGLRSVWLQWPLSEEAREGLELEYAVAAAQLDPAVAILALDDLALELPPDHALRVGLQDWFEQAASPYLLQPGARALLEAARGRYADPSQGERPLELPYPSQLGASITASGCAELLPSGTPGDLVAAVHVEVSRCVTETTTWQTEEPYSWEELVVQEVLEEVVVGYEEHCEEVPYGGADRQPDWVETVCEDRPVREPRPVERREVVKRTGSRTVEHRRYSLHVDGHLRAEIEDDLGRIAAEAPIAWTFSEEDLAWEAPGSARGWDPARSEASVRAAAPQAFETQVAVALGALEQAYADQLLDLARVSSGPVADELVVRAWWWSRHVEPSSGPLWAAMLVVERPREVSEVSYGIGPLPEPALRSGEALRDTSGRTDKRRGRRSMGGGEESP